MIDDGAGLDEGLGVGTGDGPGLAKGPGVKTSNSREVDERAADGAGLRVVPRDGMSV